MAIMIPGKPLDYSESSHEDEIFNFLENTLPDHVYVCHSLKVKYIRKYGHKEELTTREIDFFIIVPDVGCLVVEAKAGKVWVDFTHDSKNGIWYYGSGEEMPHGGPFRQAEGAKFNLVNYLKYNVKTHFSDYIHNSGITVWLPSISRSAINLWNLPPDAIPHKYILCRDDMLLGKDDFYNRIVDIIQHTRDTNQFSNMIMDKKQCETFVRTYICPVCHLIPPKNFLINLKENRMSAFLKEQMAILDFMEEQKVAVIGGAAGSGKTVIAIEKARRLAEEGKRVLFLCYNSKLKSYLESTYENKNIRYETIDSLFYSYFKSIGNQDYLLLTNTIFEEYAEEKFIYDCFIVDEAQDYGKKETEDSEFLKLLVEIAEKSNEGCCYLFYDKYQLVQSKEIPSVIQNADCKMMLYKNCRNTKSIAETSFKVFKEGEISKRQVKGFELGQIPVVCYCNKEENITYISKIIMKYKESGYKDITILTSGDIVNSSIFEYIKNDKFIYNGIAVNVSTCRRFKGLEAEAIILIDFDKDCFIDDEKRLLFYVATSRAKHELAIILNLDDNDCSEIIEKYKNKKNVKNPKRELMNYFNTKLLEK